MNVKANTYVLHLSCPVCGNALHHVASIEPLCDTIGARAECRHCDTEVSITVEMTYKRRHHVGALPKNTLPLAPLLVAMSCATYREFGDMVGIPRGVVQRFASHGVPILRADELAVLCGLHPATVWGDSYYGAVNAS